MRLKYYTTSAVSRLRSSVEARLDWYYEPTTSSAEPLIASSETSRQSTIDSPSFAAVLTLPEGSPGTADRESALRVYGSLRMLTPQQASDERLWTYLCHAECREYVANRWLLPRPTNDVHAAQRVRNHFFARDNRALIRDNGMSRLWWLGFIAHEVEPSDPSAFLERLLHRQDVRSALIERPSVSMNRRVLRGINSVMQTYWREDRTLFERDCFRSWMIGLNRRGGVVLLDALLEEPLNYLLKSEARRALTAEARRKNG